MLIGGDGIIGAAAAAAAGPAPPVPDSFRNITPASAGGRQGGAAHFRDVRAIRRELDGRSEGIGIARRIKKGLALCGHLPKNSFGGRVGAAAAPRTAELFGLIIVGHPAEQINPWAGVRRFVHENLADARCHGQHHFNIEAHFAVAAARRAHPAIDENIGDQSTRCDSGLTDVGRDIGRVIPIKLQQADVLAGAAQRCARHIGRAEIVTAIGAART